MFWAGIFLAPFSLAIPLALSDPRVWRVAWVGTIPLLTFIASYVEWRVLDRDDYFFKAVLPEMILGGMVASLVAISVLVSNS
jgi:dolichyl-phosphate-mannose--protein O-mannosyl transferase